MSTFAMSNVLISEKQIEKVNQLFEGICNKNRAALSQAITLIESSNSQHMFLAEMLLEKILPLRKANSSTFRVGISGVPGVGKSTFLENFGMQLCNQNLKVAVLAVDPSSPTSGGSILGDKTRMQTLSVHKNAFIRPSPAGNTLGGVAKKTRETIYLCEAFGFDVVCIETVGVGQSEVSVSRMTDVFCVLMLPSAGDELQGIKKGILELANFVLINKSDSEQLHKIQQAVSDYSSALKMTQGHQQTFFPKVIKTSGLTGEGISLFWQELCKYKLIKQNTGEWETLRNQQLVFWLRQSLEEEVLSRFWNTAGVEQEFEKQRQLLCSLEINGRSSALKVLSLLKSLP
jgi:LAO/AO transport system kinase